MISTLKELPNDDRRPFQEQVSHISQDLKLVMERREQGLDEDWSEDALSAEEEVRCVPGMIAHGSVGGSIDRWRRRWVGGWMDLNR